MKEQSVSKGFAVLSAAGLIVKVLSFLYIPFLIAIIDNPGYGIYMAAYSVYVFIYVLTNSGVPVAISKLISELTAKKNYKDAVRSFKIARSLLLVLGTVMSLLLLAAAKPLAVLVKFPEAHLAIMALSPTLLFTAIASAYRGYFQGRGNMTPTAISQILEQVINTVFTLLFAYLLLPYGIAAACAGGTIGTSLGALVAAVYLVISYRRNCKFIVGKGEAHLPVQRLSYEQLMRRIIDYSVPITLSVGLTYAGNLIDTWNTKSRLLAAGFSDESASALFGYLSRYVQLMNVPIALITSLAAAIIPAIAGALAVKNRELTQNRINYAFRLCMLIAIPSAAGLAVLSRPIYAFIGFGESYRIMMYGAIVLVLMCIVQIQNSVLQSCGKLYVVTFNLLWGIIIKVVLNYFLITIPDINIYGAIIGSVVGYTLPLILNGIAINRFLKVRMNLASIALKPAVSSVAMSLGAGLCYLGLSKLLSFAGEGYLTNAIAVIAAIGVGGMLYFYVLVLMGGITAEDLNSVPARLHRFIPSGVRQRLQAME